MSVNSWDARYAPYACRSKFSASALFNVVQFHCRVCTSWTWLPNDPTNWAAGGSCITRAVTPDRRVLRDPDTKVSGIMPPSPPTPPPPSPGPVPAGSQKNIIFLVNDDQDLVLGSMRAMPNTARLLGDGGANLTQFRVNTPICCPSYVVPRNALLELLKLMNWPPHAGAQQCCPGGMNTTIT